MKKIKKGSFGRGLSIAKLGFKTGVKAAGNYMAPSKNNDDYLASQIELIARELGELKGTMMKIGQGLSMYGEHFLPEKANVFLKSLQYQSPPLDWDSIETTIEKELGLKALSELEIEEKALASASLGQVHKATIKKTGEVIALKVQYPDVDSAIKSDVRNLKRVFSVAKIFPSEMKLDSIFEEIKTMLFQELDYKEELKWTQAVYENLKDDDRYIVPKVYTEFSTSKILATSFIDGHTIDSQRVKDLSQEKKNEIAFSFLDHYLNELFLYHIVQTDPHLGNYRIHIDEKTAECKLVLFDFGAMREVPEHFEKPFKKIIQAALENNKENVIAHGIELGYLKPSDTEDLKDRYFELCRMITEPFRANELEPKDYITEDKSYIWKRSDLPMRVAKAGTEVAKNYKLRTPPRESIFLDRKLGGTFVFLSVLDFQANSDQWMRDKLKTLLNP